jgi:amidase
MNWNAFTPDGQFTIAGAANGPLKGLTVAVKDIFDVAGHVTGAGNPVWAATHPVASKNAAAVDALLAAGAQIVGKTITEELAFSLVGENMHYGTPVNPHNPDCVPGGSSSGSAAAAAAGLCDIGLGSDTAGSIRLPASFCGIWGLRPTHNAISLAGVMPLAPSFDTVGWMTRSAQCLELTGQVLLPEDQTALDPSEMTLHCPADVWARCTPQIQAALAPLVDSIGDFFKAVSHEPLSDRDLVEWQRVFRVAQAGEVWATHHEWIQANAPVFGPGIRERFEWAATLGAGEVANAKKQVSEFAKKIDAHLQGRVLCMPTVAYLAPQKGQASSDEDRTNALCLLSISTMAGNPQVSMPLAKLNGKALGISLASRRHTDRALLGLARRLEHLGREISQS